jgi:hypothetical protein
MTIRIEPFVAGDVHQLALRQSQAEAQPLLADGDFVAMLARPGLAWTFRHGPRTIACGGVLPQWAGRALAWFLLGEIPRAGWFAIVRQGRRTLAEAQARGFARIETTVQADYLEGHRFLKALGNFRPEGVMARYSPAGADHVLYALLARARGEEGRRPDRERILTERVA